MIKEWIQYLRSDAPEWARERGLIYESIALQARHTRLRKAWAPHLIRSQESICDFLNKNKFVRRILVLGSGPLCDFPKQFVEEWNIHPILVDAVHPESAKKWAHQHGFKMRTADLSSPMEMVHLMLKEQLEESDAVISLNLMSQLSLFGVPQGSNEEPISPAQEHLKFLQSIEKPVLLISDFRKTQLDRQRNTIETQATIPSLVQPQRQWIWSLAPLGEMSSKYSVELEVGVWNNKQIKRSLRETLSDSEIA